MIYNDLYVGLFCCTNIDTGGYGVNNLGDLENIYILELIGF